jgi:hypothetical protein
MSQPQHALIRAAMGRISPVVKQLREDGWATEVIAHADPLVVEVRIDLSGLKRPVESLADGESATEEPETDWCKVHGLARCKKALGNTSDGQHCYAHLHGCDFHRPAADTPSEP